MSKEKESRRDVWCDLVDVFGKDEAIRFLTMLGYVCLTGISGNLPSDHTNDRYDALEYSMRILNQYRKPNTNDGRSGQMNGDEMIVDD